MRRNLERFDARLAALLPKLRDDDLLVITADHGNDPTTPSTDHSREHVPVLLAGQRRQGRRRSRHRDRRSPISGRPWPRISVSARWLTARASCRNDRRRHNGRRMSASIREQLEQREREILAPQASKSADSKGRAPPRNRRRDPPGVPARPRSHHPHQGVPSAQAQDAGVLCADRRSLSHAPDAHARSGADRADHREGAAPARRADRSDRARSRPGPHAVRPCRRAGAQRAWCRADSITTSKACASSMCSRTTAKA